MLIDDAKFKCYPVFPSKNIKGLLMSMVFVSNIVIGT